MAVRHIVAMGGGGFSMEPDNPLLDDYVLSLARRSPARVCFLPTASGDSATYVVRFYRAFTKKPCVPTDLVLHETGALARSPSSTAQIAASLREQDVIYVGGGNVANLLALWRVHGVDAALRTAWEEGVVLAGVSAGMLCWFEGCITDSFGGLRVLRDGLSLLRGSACPHYDGEPGRRPAYEQAIATGALPDGYAADDGAALHFVGDSLDGVVTSRPDAAGRFLGTRS